MKDYMKICFLFIILIFISSFVYANDTLVYIDKNNIDTKYHRVTCSHIFPDGYKEISVEDAFNKGYRRCPDCSPPLSDNEKNEREKEFDEMFNQTNPEYQRKLDEAKKLRESVGFITSNTTSNGDNRTVYITKNGSKFHSPGCNDLDSTPHKLTVEQAQGKGYAPCKVCNPYGLAGNAEKTTKKNINIPFFLVLGILIILIIYIIVNEKKYKGK